MRPYVEHILKSSANAYESSGSQFRNIKWMQAGPDAFVKLMLVMTFLTNMGENEYSTVLDLP